MRKVYICSPYRAKDGAELDRNIDYAQQLTRQALEAGLAPITPHLYMTQCMDDKKPEERARGMAAGLALLKCCDFVIAGVKYGISTQLFDRALLNRNGVMDIWNMAHVEDGEKYYIRKEYTEVSELHKGSEQPVIIQQVPQQTEPAAGEEPQNGQEEKEGVNNAS